ncbi:MAG TPA: ABC transporter permease, partial [Thermoleophilaceae bacterium]
MRGDVRSRVLPADVLRLGLIGLRTRPVRAALSALGIAIGIASMVAVLGISASSAASLNAALDRLGTNLLTVTPGESILGQSAKIPRAAAPKIAHMSTVRRASAVTAVEGATVRRNPHVDAVVTNGIAVATADLSLPAAVGARLASGGFLTRASRRLPAVVLGSTAARRLGIVDAGRGATMVYVAGRWLTVVGVLAPVELAHELDAAALVGAPYARAEFGTRSNPSTIYVRAQPERVPETRSLLAGTADP